MRAARRLASASDLRRKFIAVRVVTLNYWSGRRLITEKIDKQKDGLDIRSVLSFLVCLCLVLVLYFTQLVPQKSRLEQAQHAMCGGDLDFVYAKDPILSTYPDFAHDCGDFTQCGNTCCVPSNGAAQAMAGE